MQFAACYSLFVESCLIKKEIICRSISGNKNKFAGAIPANKNEFAGATLANKN